MSTRNRSRSPHFRSHSPNNQDLSLSPTSSKKREEKQALWRQRRQAAELDDYEQRCLSPARLSPYRCISPARSRINSNAKEVENNSESIDWTNEENYDENDQYLERVQRALGGLENYKNQFNKYTVSDENIPENKENLDPISTKVNQQQPLTNNINNKTPKSANNKRQNSNNNFQSPTDDSLMPKKSSKTIQIEEDENVLIRRQKDIDYGKNQDIYCEYLQNVNKENRSDMQPWTPDKYEKMTRRNWDKQVRIWRKQLHYWKDPKPISELLTPGTSPCPSPVRRRSPGRMFLNPNNSMPTETNPPKSQLSRPLFGDVDDDAMTGFPETIQTENILSSNAVSSMKKEDLMDDNSNSCMSVDADPGVPVAFRK